MPYQFLTRQPYKHQMETIQHMLCNKRAYDFSDLGSGKTSSSIWFSDILLEAGKIKKVLIVCPLSIINAVWAEEIKAVVPNRSYSIVHGTRAARIKALQKDAHFYITNHDAPRTYEAELLAMKFDVVIMDEVDAFKNAQSKRSKAMQRICAKAKAVYGLTGTPMANSPTDAFGIAKVVNPDRLPTPYITRWRQLTMTQYGEHIWEPNKDAERIVHNVLQPAIRHRLEDCVDIPDMTFEYREFELEAKQKKIYKEMYNHQLVELKEGLIVASTAAVKFTKLLQISAGVVYDNDGNPIVLNTKEKVNDILRVQKEAGQVIVFVQFVEVIKHLVKIIPNARELYGDVPQKTRANTIKDFRAGDFNILIAQPRIAAHGLNLQFCNHIIFFTPILGNSYYRQAIGRVRRSGQTKPQVIINYYSSKAEKHLYKTLETKDVSSQMLLDMYN